MGEMDFFSGDLKSVVNPRDMVRAFTHQKGEASSELFLENLALVTFTSQDLHSIVQSRQQARLVGTWRNRNPRIYRGQGWVAVQSPFGAPGTIMLLEELVAFGVRRIILLGYCGTIQKGVFIGDLVLPLEAIREEGTSYHYLPKGEKSLPDLEIQRKLFDSIGRIGLPLASGNHLDDRRSLSGNNGEGETVPNGGRAGSRNGDGGCICIRKGSENLRRGDPHCFR